MVDGAVARADVELLRLVDVDILEEQVTHRRRARLRLLHGLIDLNSRCSLDVFQLRGRGELKLEQVALGALDRVARLAHARHLIAVAVRDAWVGHRVAVVPVRVHLEHDRTVLERIRLREAHALAHVEHIHAVHLDAGHVVAARVVVRVGR